MSKAQLDVVDTSSQDETIEEILDECKKEKELCADWPSWRRNHRLGWPSYKESVILDNFRAITRKHFGLELLVAHRKPRRDKPAGLPCHRKVIRFRTVTSLILRNSTLRDQWRDSADQNDPLKTHAITAKEKQMPQRPPDQVLARFRRAMTMLGLEPFVHPNVLREAASTSSPMEAGENGDGTTRKSPPEVEQRWPRLVML